MSALDVMGRATWAGFEPAPLANEMRAVAARLRLTLARVGDAGPEHEGELTIAALFAGMLRLSASTPVGVVSLRARDLAMSFGRIAEDGGPAEVARLVLDLLERRPAGMSAQAAAITAIAVVAALVDRAGILDNLLEPFGTAQRAALRGAQ
jgi:hypothetical protein